LNRIWIFHKVFNPSQSLRDEPIKELIEYVHKILENNYKKRFMNIIQIIGIQRESYQNTFLNKEIKNSLLNKKVC
jgi:hypothetical protein